MPFKIQPQLFSGPFFIDLELVSSFSVQNMGPADAELAFDEDGMAYTVPLPAKSKYDFPYQGDYLAGRVHCRPVQAETAINVVVISTVFTCATK